MQTSAGSGRSNKPPNPELSRASQAGPAAGLNATWTACTPGTVLSVSSTNMASYSFTSADCDGAGLTAITEVTGGNANSQPRVLISTTSSNNVLRFDRSSLSGAPATLVAAHLKSTAGDLFKLTNLTLFPTNSGNQTLTVTAYKAGVAISGSTITINYLSTTPIHATTLTTSDFGNNYNSIDEIRATTSTGIGIALDNIQTAVALPVSFLYFNGQSTGSNILLNWATAVESNVKNFDIERSLDGAHFLTRGVVGSKADGGNSSSPLDYSYTDWLDGSSPLSLFYRLRESDMDGQLTYSQVLKVQLASNASAGLSVYPNPFTQQVIVSVTSSNLDKAVIIVTDLSGRRVLQQDNTLQKGSNVLSLSALSQLSKGLYLFTITTGQQKRTVELMKTE